MPHTPFWLELSACKMHSMSAATLFTKDAWSVLRRNVVHAAGQPDDRPREGGWLGVWLGPSGSEDGCPQAAQSQGEVQLASVSCISTEDRSQRNMYHQPKQAAGQTSTLALNSSWPPVMHQMVTIAASCHFMCRFCCLGVFCSSRMVHQAPSCHLGQVQQLGDCFKS